MNRVEKFLAADAKKLEMHEEVAVVMSHDEIREMIEHDVMLHRWHMDNLALRMAREKPTQKAWISMQPKYGRKK